MSYPPDKPYGYPSPYGPPGYPMGPQVPGGYPQPGAYPSGPPVPGAYPAYPYPYPGGYVYPGQPPVPAPAPGLYPPPPYSAGPSGPVARSYYFVRSRLNGYVLDIEGGNRNPGARVILWSQKATDNDNQLWYDDFQTGTIRNKMNDFCLDIQGDALVVQPFCPNNTNQQFERAEPFIRNRLSPNRVLDVAGGKKNAGATVIIYQKHGGSNQCFDVQFTQPQSAAPVPRQKFFIVSEMNGKALDIRGDDANAGAQVIMYPKKGGNCPNQLWYFDEQGVIRSALNHFALESRATESAVRMVPFNGDVHQRWTFMGNRIMKNQQDCLDIRGGSKSDGAEVISYPYKGSVNQHWRLVYV